MITHKIIIIKDVSDNKDDSDWDPDELSERERKDLKEDEKWEDFEDFEPRFVTEEFINGRLQIRHKLTDEEKIIELNEFNNMFNRLTNTELDRSKLDRKRQP
jgi:hypothetical protein